MTCTLMLLNAKCLRCSELLGEHSYVLWMRKISQRWTPQKGVATSGTGILLADEKLHAKEKYSPQVVEASHWQVRWCLPDTWQVLQRHTQC